MADSDARIAELVIDSDSVDSSVLADRRVVGVPDDSTMSVVTEL